MGDVTESNLNIYGFRFLGGGGADRRHFDRLDVLADSNGEVIYTPNDGDCFDDAADALRSLLSCEASSFVCGDDEYRFELEAGRVVPKFVYGDIASHVRQTRGFRIAMQRISVIPDAADRIAELAKLTSSMLAGGCEEYVQRAAARMEREIGRVRDDRLRGAAISEVCDAVERDLHPIGITTQLLRSLLPLVRTIDDPDAFALAMSRVARAMGRSSLPRMCAELFREAEDAALMIPDRRRHYALRAQVAADMAAAGMKEASFTAFEELLGEIETVAFFQDNAGGPSSETNDFFAGFVEVMMRMESAELGEYRFPLARDAIMLIKFIGDESIHRDAVRAASALIAGSNHIDSERMTGVLVGLSMDLGG